MEKNTEIGAWEVIAQLPQGHAPDAAPRRTQSAAAKSVVELPKGQQQPDAYAADTCSPPARSIHVVPQGQKGDDHAGGDPDKYARHATEVARVRAAAGLRPTVAPTLHLLDEQALAELRRHVRHYDNWVAARIALGNSIFATCMYFCAGKPAAAETLKKQLLKGAGKHPDIEEAQLAVAPLIAAYRALEQPIRDKQHTIEKIGRTLPLYSVVEGIRGFGAANYAHLIAMAGDLASYPKKGHLWKRLGLALDREGKPYKNSRDKDRALEAGYSARNRSKTFVLADTLMKKPELEGSNAISLKPYYDAQKARFIETGATKAHAHMHAMRLLSKRAVFLIWKAWREAARDPVSAKAISSVPQGHMKLANAEAGTNEIGAGKSIRSMPQGHDGRDAPRRASSAPVKANRVVLLGRAQHADTGAEPIGGAA